MSEITLVRQHDKAISEPDKMAARRVIFGAIDGMGDKGRKQWRRFWSAALRMEPGEIITVTTHKARSGPFHRRHMAIETAVFEAQERFTDFEMFRYWGKVGAGWVTWAAGPRGGVVPVPKSISYAAADDGEFREFHDQLIDFYRGPHAARYLWPHLKDKADEMMESILQGFEQ